MENQKIELEVWQKFTEHPKLGEILISHRKITIAQLGEALSIQKNQNLPIGEILIEIGIISKDELLEVLELQSSIDKMLDESFNDLKKLNENE